MKASPTNSATDLAIKGEGFFIVQSPSGQNVLTRAGNFVPNGDGELINAAGFTPHATLHANVPNRCSGTQRLAAVADS